jgi:hypothetical protein
MKLNNLFLFIQYIIILFCVSSVPIAFLSSSSSSNENEQEEEITYHGPCDLEYAPIDKMECFERTNHTHTCCFAEIIDESENIQENSLHKLYSLTNTFCFGIETYFSFAPHFIKEIRINNEIKKVHLTCRYESQRTCSRANPEILEDCRMHGSKTNSCCKINLLNKETNCILSNKYFGEEKNNTIFGNLIECYSCVLNNSTLILIITILIIFL